MTKHNFATSALVFLTFWGAVNLSGLSGPLALSARFLSGCAVLLVWLAVEFMGRESHEWKVRPIGAVLSVLAVILFTQVPFEASQISFALVLWLLARRVLPELGIAVLVCSIVGMLPSWFAGANAPMESVASVIARIALGLTGREVSADVVIGGSYVGLPMAFWALVCLAATQARGIRRRPLICACLVPVIVLAQFAVGDWVHSVASMFASHGHDPQLFWHLPLLSVGLAGLVAVGFVGQPEPAPNQSNGSGSHFGWSVAAITALCSTSLLSSWRLVEPIRQASFLNVGGFNWKRPSFGEKEGGMFGLLPEYLRADGWSVNTLATAGITKEGLANTQVLVLINCPIVWEADQREVIENFVTHGGSLLVLGDHTDIFGLMKGFNSLLSEWGIEFLFDSGCYENFNWDALCDWNPWSTKMRGDARTVGVQIGSSLSVQPPALQALNARYGFSDLGIRENEMGAFLGNYKYQLNEGIGDICLVATADVGKGSVWAYGDTSGFQNFGLGFNWDSHLSPLFDRLARPAAGIPNTGRLGLLGIVAVLLGFTLRARTRRHLPGMIVGMASGLVIGLLPIGSDWMRDPITKSEHPRLVIDHSMFPNIGHYRTEWNSVTPLALAGLRSGLLVEHRTHSYWGDLGKGDALAFVGPRKKFDSETQEGLVDLLERGGCILVFASGSDASGIEGFLSRFGLQIEQTQLGEVPPPKFVREDEPTFIDASPLLFTADKSIQKLFEYGTDTLALVKHIGEGVLVVVGDTRMCSARNVEGQWGARSANARFLVDFLLDNGVGVPQELNTTFSAPVGGM